MLILLRFLFIRKDEKPNDINECVVKSDRLLGPDLSDPHIIGLVTAKAVTTACLRCGFTTLLAPPYLGS